MRIPCGGPLNLLRNQYVSWRASVFLETITSECANIPAFSYLGASGLHRSSLQKLCGFCAHNIPQPVGLEESTSYQRVDLDPKGDSVFSIPFGAR